MNSRKRETIDLRKLANDPNSQIDPMLRELEGRAETERSSRPGWPTRFVTAGKLRSLVSRPA